MWITTVSGTKIAAVKAQWNAERPMTLVGVIHTAGGLLRGGGRNSGVKEIDQKRMDKGEQGEVLCHGDSTPPRPA